MQTWIALLPDRPAAGLAVPKTKIKLIGRLPAEAHIAILQFLPIPDLPSFALCSRQLAQLTRDDRLWRRKLLWLDYRGPGAIPWQANGSEVPNDLTDSLNRAAIAPEDRLHTGIHLDNHHPPPVKRTAPPASPSSSTLFSAGGDDDDFGDFFDGHAEGDVSTIQDDGFGDFQDFGSGGGKLDASDPFGLAEDFGGMSLGAGKAVAPKKVEDLNQDLLMMWDEDDAPTTKPPKPIARIPIPRTRTPPPAPLPRSDLQSLRDVFIAHHALLLPYYLSLVNHTTSSLIFTSSTLTPSTRSQLLSSLTRFCSPLLAPTRSLPQRTTVIRNVQSAIDFFESAMLAEFERADTRRDEDAMREKATVLWELNGASSVVQVFVQKREIFYEQGHNPLRNLVSVLSLPSRSFIPADIPAGKSKRRRESMRTESISRRWTLT